MSGTRFAPKSANTMRTMTLGIAVLKETLPQNLVGFRPIINPFQIVSGIQMMDYMTSMFLKKLHGPLHFSMTALKIDEVCLEQSSSW